MFGNPEKKAEKAHRKALKEIRWALKAAGITEEQLVVAMETGEEGMEDLMLLTERDMIWVKRGGFGGGKELGRVDRDRVLGVRRDLGRGLVFTIDGGSLPNGSVWPYGDQAFANTFNFLDVLTGGRLVEWMTPEERANPFGFMRELNLTFPRDETAPQAPPPVAPPPVPTTAPQDIPDMIRKLGELRDAGLLTAEEFEMKKQDLLRRM